MKKSTILIFPVLFIISILSFPCRSERNDSLRSYRGIENAIADQLERHPYSGYRDIYKSFMQDSFGPGHLLADTLSARRYLLHELETTEELGGPEYEMTGDEGHFFRVNLSLIKEELIPFETYFEAFLESMSGLQPISGDIWREKWKEVDKTIGNLGVRFENEESDRKMISEAMNEGKFIVHHTPAFNKTSNFHYRIFSRSIFLEKLFPLIRQRIKK